MSWEVEGYPLAAVFVHGWWGDHAKTWTWTPSILGLPISTRKVHLCDLLAEDDELRCNYYSMPHSAGPLAQVEIATLATSLNTFLRLYVKPPHVILVAHSLGGLVCRAAILESLRTNDTARDRVVGLLTFGTPNNGTELARAAGRYLASLSAKQMEPLSRCLEDLNRDWVQHVVNGGDPQLAFSERLNLHCQSVIGERDWVVPRASGASLCYLGEIQAINKTHIGLPKAASPEDPTCKLTKTFIVECGKRVERKRLLDAGNQLSDRIRRAVVGSGTAEEADWTLEERDHITLAYPQPLGQVTESEVPGILECAITSTRKGGIARPDFRVCVSVQPHEPTDERIDYQHIVGKGLMSEAEYRALAEALRTASISRQQLDRVLKVERITVSSGGAQQVYEFETFTPGDGYAVLSYRCQGDPSAWGRDNTLDISLRTIITKRHGWYCYFVTRTIVERLRVTLEAPFSVVARPHVWWREVKREEGPTGNDAYASKVVVEGPVPCGTSIDWVFTS